MMGKAGILLLSALVAAICTTAAAAQTVPEKCKTMACRKPGTVTLRLVEGGTATPPRAVSPYFDGSVLTLAPGETVTLGYSKSGGKPALASVSDEAGPVDIGPVPAADSMLSFSLKQDDGKPSMTLVVTNTTGNVIRYQAHMYVLAGGGIRSLDTSTCPVLPPQGAAPSFSAIETWPRPIVHMVIGLIQALPPDARPSC
jgi:hypothetical protein